MKINQSTCAIVSSLAALAFAGSANAANVLWVDSSTTGGGAGLAPNTTWTNLLQTVGGHTVTTFDGNTHNWSLNNASSQNYVNSFDVVIVNNSNNIFNAIRAHGATWNAQATPMINLNPYFLSGQFSSASWRWGTGTGGTPNGVSNALSVDAPGDAVWSGITLNAGPTAPDLYDAAARYYDIGGSLLTGVTAVASNPSDSTQLAIAHAAAGSLQTGGGEQYFFATNGGNEPFTADGETAFLNAIDALAPSVVVIPEPSTALLGLVGAAIFLRRRR